MTPYEFLTVWRVRAPVERVWDEISHPELWPAWWRGVERVVELERGEANGVGSTRRFTWKSILPYTLTFDLRVVRAEPMTLIEAIADGDLRGTGRWEFSTDGDATVARYTWSVRTTAKWMNLLSPLARPLFVWNHDAIMAWGLEGLKRRLNGAQTGDHDC